MKYTIKQIIIFLLIIVIIVMIVISIKNKPEIKIINNTNTPTVVEQKTYNLCYYRTTKTTRGFYDTAWLKLNITGEKITGEFYNLPAEKDSKVGEFTGTVGPVEKESMSRTATVWWNSQAEGMNNKEELIIKFGDGSATAGFGEMADSQLGDGIYLYKDKTKLTYIDEMSQKDCQFLDEKLFAEKYIRDNIKDIATNKPVLGGSWYVTSVKVNEVAHIGEVTYEDGHIESKATFTYTYQENPQSITVTKWIIVK